MTSAMAAGNPAPMPAVAAAFEDGRLSYSKVRALTRVVDLVDEEALLDYALRVTAAQLEERCREIRNSAPESVGTAWRAWEHRSLMVFRNPERGMVRIVVEMPTEDGEIVAKAIERVAEAGDEAIGIEFAAGRGGADGREVREVSPNGWRAPGGPSSSPAPGYTVPEQRPNSSAWPRRSRHPSSRPRLGVARSRVTTRSRSAG